MVKGWTLSIHWTTARHFMATSALSLGLVPGGIRVIGGHRLCKLCCFGTKVLFVDGSGFADNESHHARGAVVHRISHEGESWRHLATDDVVRGSPPCMSSLAATVSKYHEPFFFTKGIGKGQFSAPTTRVVVPSISVTNRCISRYLTTKLTRESKSSCGSPDKRTPFPAGPRMLNGACSSCACIASKRARLASSAKAKVRWPGSWANIGADEQPKKSTNIAETANRTKLLHSS